MLSLGFAFTWTLTSSTWSHQRRAVSSTAFNDFAITRCSPSDAGLSAWSAAVQLQPAATPFNNFKKAQNSEICVFFSDSFASTCTMMCFHAHNVMCFQTGIALMRTDARTSFFFNKNAGDILCAMASDARERDPGQGFPALALSNVQSMRAMIGAIATPLTVPAL